MSDATSSRSSAISSRSAISLVRETHAASPRRPSWPLRRRLLDALVGKNASAATRDSFRKKLRDGELDEKEVELEVSAGQAGMPMLRASRDTGRLGRRDLETGRHPREGARPAQQDAQGPGAGRVAA